MDRRPLTIPKNCQELKLKYKHSRLAELLICILTKKLKGYFGGLKPETINRKIQGCLGVVLVVSKVYDKVGILFFAKLIRNCRAKMISASFSKTISKVVLQRLSSHFQELKNLNSKQFRIKRIKAALDSITPKQTLDTSKLVQSFYQYKHSLRDKSQAPTIVTSPEISFSMDKSFSRSHVIQKVNTIKELLYGKASLDESLTFGHKNNLITKENMPFCEVTREPCFNQQGFLSTSKLQKASARTVTSILKYKLNNTYKLLFDKLVYQTKDHSRTKATVIEALKSQKGNKQKIIRGLERLGKLFSMKVVSYFKSMSVRSSNQKPIISISPIYNLKPVVKLVRKIQKFTCKQALERWKNSRNLEVTNVLKLTCLVQILNKKVYLLVCDSWNLILNCRFELTMTKKVMIRRALEHWQQFSNYPGNRLFEAFCRWKRIPKEDRIQRLKSYKKFFDLN